MESLTKERLIEGLTMQQWIDRETRRRKTTWWGQPCFIQPVIHSEIFGDGLQLAYLGTISQRPNYWLIRIDSTVNVYEDDFDYEEHLLTPLEEQFGRVPETFVYDGYEFQRLKRSDRWDIDLDEFDNYKQYKKARRYPVVNWDGGHWGMVVNFGTGEIGEY